MRKANYKGRCEKRKVSKCEYICRTYSKIQSVYVDELEKDDTVASFECNVFLKGVADTLYTTDFVIKMTDGSIRVRECVWRFNLNKPSYDRCAAQILWLRTQSFATETWCRRISSCTKTEAGAFLTGHMPVPAMPVPMPPLRTCVFHLSVRSWLTVTCACSAKKRIWPFNMYRSGCRSWRLSS